MAVELHEGNYALHQDTSKKDVIQLKLTDSALRAIEACQNNIRVQTIMITFLWIFCNLIVM